MNTDTGGRILFSTPPAAPDAPQSGSKTLLDLPGRVLLIIAILFAVQPAFQIGTMAQEAPELQINSKRYIVVDVESGSVFAQKDARDEVPIASLTKVFTAIQAMAMAPLDTEIMTQESDLMSPEGDYWGSSGTVMGFGAGETFTLEDMLYGMLLPSGNDAANAIARTLGAQPGDTAEEATQRFMDLMNQRVRDMGLTNTHLDNPHGWGVPGHYSSAWDVAALARYVTYDPVLMEMLGTRNYTTSTGLTLSNTNRLLAENDSIIGGKTGFDLDAGYCLMNIAGQGDDRMIAVTLDGIAPGDWYDDNRLLLEYGFNQKRELIDSGESFSGDTASFVDPAPVEIARGVASEGAIAGSVVRTSQMQEPLVADEAPPGPAVVRSERTIWLAIMAAIGVIAIRGAITYRGPAGRRLPIDMSPIDT